MMQAENQYTNEELGSVLETIEKYVFRNFTICGKVANKAEIYMAKIADIGVFGGSGFYKFLENIEEVKIDTPYGEASDALFIGKIGDKKAFLLDLRRFKGALSFNLDRMQ